jgi:hypothetical protein
MKNWRLYPSDVSDEIWVFVTLHLTRCAASLGLQEGEDVKLPNGLSL